MSELNIPAERLRAMQEESLWNAEAAEQEAVERLATADFPYPIEVDENGVYWTDNGSTKLGRLEP